MNSPYSLHAACKVHYCTHSLRHMIFVYTCPHTFLSHCFVLTFALTSSLWRQIDFFYLLNYKTKSNIVYSPRKLHARPPWHSRRLLVSCVAWRLACCINPMRCLPHAYSPVAVSVSISKRSFLFVIAVLCR